MLDSGGGGGYSGVTNWYLHDVPTMWTMLRDQQTDNHWIHVSGWRKTSELTSTHLWRLEEYRDKLAEAWPPEKNAAAAAYLARLNYLIESVRQTHDTAAANYTTLAGATSAISTARHELKTVYDEYVAKQQEKKDYEDRVAFDAASQLPGTTQGDPPVTDADLERLNDKARGIMYALSSELSQAQAEIKQPPPYKPARTIAPGDPDVDLSGGGSAPPPVIPPIVPAPVPAAGRSAPATTAPGTQVVPAPIAPGVGPVLGGAGPLAPPAPVNPVSPAVIIPAPPPAPGPGGGMLPGLPAGPGMLPGSGGIRGASPIAAPVNPATGSVVKPGAGSVAGAPRAMPVGGLIGGAPGAGLGQPGAGAASARRINPVGGVIGGAGTTPMGGTGRRPGGGTSMAFGDGGQPVGAAHSGRPGVRRDNESGPRWDPDNPWETDEGVAPVVLPPREAGRIDPGPAIGFHR